MALSDKTQRSRNRRLYITEESTNGTPVYPSGTDAFLAAELDGFTQATQTAEAQEYTADLFTQAEQVVGYDYANPTMTIHPRFGSAAGQLPIEAILLKNFFGTQTQTGSDVTYSFADHDNTLSAYYQITDVLQCVASGLVVSELSFTVGKGDLMAYDFTCISNKIQHSAQFEVPTGTASIAAATPATIPVGDQASYVAQVGSRFDVYDDTGTLSEAGIEVLSVSGTNITADTTVAIEENYVLKPALPSPTYTTARPFAPTSATVYVGPSATSMSSLINSTYAFKSREVSVSMNKNIQTPTADELNGSLFGGPDYEIDVPSIEISTTLNLRPGTARYYEQARTDQLRAIAITIPYGTQELVLYLPSVFMEVSDGGENAGASQQTLDFRVQKGSSTDANVCHLIYR